MVRTVAWMQSLGFRTTDSGDGRINVQAGMEGALPFPHVVAIIDDPLEMVAESWRLLDACKAAGLTGARIEASYSPCDGVALVMLYGVEDASWGADEP